MYRRTTSAALLLACAWFAEPVDAACAFVGEHIVTFDGTTPSALVVRNGMIDWLGASADLGRHLGECDDIVELGEMALLPGFIDAHGHFPFLASMANMVNVASPPVGPVEDIADLQRQLLAADDSDTDGWLIGRGYDDSLLAERRHPDRDDLDAVSRTRPIALIHVSGHLMAANSAALAAVGIDANEDDPPGGHIRRRPGSNEPNGVLEENCRLPAATTPSSRARFRLGAVGVRPKWPDERARRCQQHGIGRGVARVTAIDGSHDVSGRAIGRRRPSAG